MSQEPEENQEKKVLPFFARYLENQLPEDLRDLSEEESESVTGGAQVTTLKFPSDNEESGHGTVTSPFKDGLAATNKYPSDGDDRLPPDFEYK
ncbi:MAG: microviridin/marinostatin family tricyclic proteinase inhibitor [Xenococcaceae cyanobacterium]